MIIAFISGSVVILALLILIIKVKNDTLNIYISKINKAENELQILFEKELSLLIESQSKLSNDTSKEEFSFKYNLEEDMQDEFKLNSILYKAYNEVKMFLSDRPNYIPNDDTKELLDNLYNIDLECKAVKSYYNDNVLIMNKKISKFPNNIIAKFKKIQKKELYNDPVIEEFEILKKK